MQIPLLPPDHPERYALADEVHARPPEPLESPSRATYLAVLIDAEDREHERDHLVTLCAHHAVAPPPAGATHFIAGLGALRLKWERHGEFSGYTFSVAGHGIAPWSEPPSALLPPGWLAAVPGTTVVAAQAELWPADADGSVPDAATLAQHFGPQIVVGAEIGDGAGLAFTDFRIQADGCTRLLVLNRSFTPRQAGRMLQRLFEIEAYRMMSLLALPIARRQSPRIVAIEKALAALTDDIAREHGSGDEALLHELTRLAAEVESGLAASQFRFGACRAYYELVTRRIAELRESRLQGLQTIEEFMARRYTPAVATCSTVSQRLHDLSERVAQASGLLSTRVEIARERQNQRLLGSMDRRAKLQLRLQQTVEGLSVAAIIYYVAGLAGSVAKALKAAGAHVEPDLVVGVAIPIVAVLVILALRGARRHLPHDESAGHLD
ncbi:MAG: DUF3422 domain-containing protein [Burkholderiales bacterium]